MRDLQLPGRSVVHAVNGAAATSHPVGTMVAIDTLRKGGTAVDAAIAACAVQCVVEPMSTGLGGDCFALVVPPGESEPVGLNASGYAPAGLTAEIARAEDGDTIGLQSPHSVTIPGAVAGWKMLHDRFGRLPWWQVLQPAIDAAADGFAITPRVAVDWERAGAKLHANPAAARHYLRDGRYPVAGERFAIPALAQVLKAIQENGADGFYRGWVAEDLVASLNALGGRHSLEDFAEFQPEFVTPVSTEYRGCRVWQIPPNGQGTTMLVLLNLLEGFDLSALDPLGPERLHLETEASRLAYAARDAYIADPRFAEVPLERLLSRDYAAAQRARIARDRVLTDVAEITGHVHRDTIYLTVVDRQRMVCSFINSLYFPFGSGLCGERSGVLLQNRGCGFVLKEGHPNLLQPRKRPKHTIIPALATRDGRPWLSFGVMGGDYQPVGQAHVLTNIVDYGMDVQEALDCPRVFYNAGRLDVERGVPMETRAALAALGHPVTTPEMPWGGGQAIMIDWENDTFAAGSDPRKDGCALGW